MKTKGGNVSAALQEVKQNPDIKRQNYHKRPLLISFSLLKHTNTETLKEKTSSLATSQMFLG